MNKLAYLNKGLISSLAIALLLVACKSTPMKEAPAKVEEKSTSTQPTTPLSTPEAADTTGVKEVMVDSSDNNKISALHDPNNILSKRVIYFDYDKDEVKAEFRPIVEAHAKYLLANPQAKMMIQGNTDARGTTEYNLSLGQRRSVAVKKALNLLGVQDKQIETVSYGKEKSTTCSDEDCYKLNRHADITYEVE